MSEESHNLNCLCCALIPEMNLMSVLDLLEKMKLEKLFGITSSYVLDFSNRTFAQFMTENTRLNIYDSKYDYVSGWKVNRLRAFWDQEPNHIVSKLLTGLLEYYKQTHYFSFPN